MSEVPDRTSTGQIQFRERYQVIQDWFKNKFSHDKMVVTATILLVVTYYHVNISIYVIVDWLKMDDHITWRWALSGSFTTQQATYTKEVELIFVA